MDTRVVSVVVGSIRKESYARRVAKTLTTLAPSSLRFNFVDIGNLPHYDQDADDQNRPPLEWREFRDSIQGSDAVLFVTPEYNRSVPGVLKNALDVGSRPYGKSVWNGRPAAIMSVTPGAMGGFGANHHLRQVLVFLNMPTLQQPEAYIGGAADLYPDGDTLANENTRIFFTDFMVRFAHLVETHLSARKVLELA